MGRDGNPRAACLLRVPVADVPDPPSIDPDRLPNGGSSVRRVDGAAQLSSGALHWPRWGRKTTVGRVTGSRTRPAVHQPKACRKGMLPRHRDGVAVAGTLLVSRRTKHGPQRGLSAEKMHGETVDGGQSVTYHVRPRPIGASGPPERSRFERCRTSHNAQRRTCPDATGYGFACPWGRHGPGEAAYDARSDTFARTPSRRPTPQMRRAAFFPPGRPFAEIERFAPGWQGAPNEAR